jgi:hypothetical protein
MRLSYILSLSALLIASPAIAQVGLTLDSSQPEGGVSLTAPPNLSIVTDDSSSSEEPSHQTQPPNLSIAPPSNEESSSEEMSHMTQPPNLASSSEDDEETDDDSSDQPSGPPVASKDALQLFYDACHNISGGVENGFDKVNDAGWTPDETDDPGPYNAIYSGYQTLGGYGDVTLWGSLQSFPTQRLGYCRVDFSDTDNVINFEDMGGIGGLTGKLDDRGDGQVYGTWETADKKLLVIADRNDGAVEIEYNFILGDAPAP